MKKNLHIKFTAFALCLSLMLPGPLGAYASNVPATETGSTQATEQTPEADSAAVPVTEDTTTPATEAMSEESKDTQAEQTETETESRETQAPQETESQETESQESQSQETQAPEDESTESDSPDIDAATFSVGDDLTAQFVHRLYNIILLRDPDPNGLSDWVTRLKSGVETGAEVAFGFVFSDEFIEHNYSNDKFVELLYNAILGRNPDPDGQADWIGRLESGFSRLYILSGFIGSPEFTKLCEDYGIVRGNIASTDVVDTHPNITQFVNRLYRLILLRKPDSNGIHDWVNRLATGAETGAEVTRGFVFSDEFIGQNYSNEKYVELLYQAILGRDADEPGKADWVEQLDIGFSRLKVLDGFIGSQEFIKLCDEYGIVKGSINLADVIDRNPKLTHFVNRLYTLILQRKPDHNGLTDWVGRLSERRETAAQVITGFIDSNEFKGRNYSDEEYITILYQTIFDRLPDEGGMKTWKQHLDTGMSRTFVLYHMVCSNEFTYLCQEYDVTKGDIKLTEPRDLNSNLTGYVNTTIKNCLGRKGSSNDLNNWVSKLSGAGTKPSDFIKTLLFSQEANTSSLSNEAFANKIFQTVLHRSPSATEQNSCINTIVASGRESAIENLIQTTEFKDLVAGYGLSEGRRYQNPAGYYQIQNAIAPLSGGGYELNLGYMGLKVYKVQKKLGISNHRAIVDMTFINAVRKFQQQKGLKVDGIVGLNTWRALGFSDNDWYNIGTYISPLKVNENSSKSDHIEAAINTAYSYLGTEYIIGASGTPGSGVDCSGLVMQALYSAGLDLSPINPVRHSRAGYEYESQSMFDSSKFKHVNYNDRQRGDLIFYQGSYGNIIHVAIYLGNNQVIEAWPPQVVVWPITNAQRSNIAGVVRPFV